MKLASLKDGRDGRLVVVSDDLAYYADAGHIVASLQAALDDWDRYEPALRLLATDLQHEAIPLERFHERDAASPLPRAYQWADGSAYVNHVALVRQARGAEMPDSFWHDPLMYQGGSDAFLGPRDDIPLADESWGCDLEAEDVIPEVRRPGEHRDARRRGPEHLRHARQSCGESRRRAQIATSTSVGPAERLAVELDLQAAVQLAFAPLVAERFRRDEHRREARCRL